MSIFGKKTDQEIGRGITKRSRARQGKGGEFTLSVTLFLVQHDLVECEEVFITLDFL